MTKTVLELKRPYCPNCLGCDLRTLRSVGDQGDGTTMRRTECRSCGFRFVLILVPPNIGRGTPGQLYDQGKEGDDP